MALLYQSLSPGPMHVLCLPLPLQPLRLNDV